MVETIHDQWAVVAALVVFVVALSVWVHARW